MDNRYGMRKALDPSKSVGTMAPGGDGREGVTHPGSGPQTYDPNAAQPSGLFRPGGPQLGLMPQGGQQMEPGAWPGGNQPPSRSPYGGQQMAMPGGWPGGQRPDSFTNILRRRFGQMGFQPMRAGTHQDALDGFNRRRGGF